LLGSLRQRFDIMVSTFAFQFSLYRYMMVRVRHPGMQTPAGATAASGLDLIVTPNSAIHALVEFASPAEAANAVAVLNNDRDWRNGLRVRLLVRPGAKKNQDKNKKQQQQQQQQQKGDAGAAAGAEGGEGGGSGEGAAAAAGGEGGEEGAAATEGGEEGGGADGTPKKKNQKGKYGRQKRDYSQWASAAAFKENKTFIVVGLAAQVERQTRSLGLNPKP
jgi:La-related protein 7